MGNNNDVSDNNVDNGDDDNGVDNIGGYDDAYAVDDDDDALPSAFHFLLRC